jgi:spermidine/putrescine ABC transporter ATP-binding subunit
MTIAAPMKQADASDTARKQQVFLERVTKRYEDVTAVAEVTLEVWRGEFLTILGPSGSGKTTTMRIIGGFVRPDSGRVEIEGRDVTDLPPNRRDVNTVFQSYGLFPHMSVEQNVAYGLRVKRVSRPERQRRVDDALALVRLQHEAKRRPAELSGGMKQRVALARALVNEPSVLLLDEPLGALDRKLREEMQVELRKIQTNLGMTFVYVTHDQDEALGMSDRLVVMRDGRVVQIGPPGSVYDDPINLWVAGFVGSSNQLDGTVRSKGPPIELETDVAPVVAMRSRGELRAGSRATMVVRPEHVAISRDQASSGVNCIRVRVGEVLNLGNHVKVVATTPGGVEFLARRQRPEIDSLGLDPGDEVYFEWAAEAPRIYGSEPPPEDLPQVGREANTASD